MRDVGSIKASVNLVDLAGRRVALRKVAATGGGEYAGPCPKCGGRDRFHVSAAGWWFCRQCHDKRGDAIEYVRWLDGLTFAAACDQLGALKAADSGQGARDPRRDTRPAGSEPQPAAPSAAWQERARRFVAYTQSELWANVAALAYLRGRGLSDDTIRAAGLGYHSQDRRDKAARWGLDGGDVWLPTGWIIPCEVGGVLWYVKVRRPQGDPKYVALRGSVKAGVVYGLDDARGCSDVIFCEGEINCLLLRQALAGVAGVVSVGDAGNRPHEGAFDVLARIARWWVAFDHDAAGRHGADRLSALSARARSLAWPWSDRGEKYDIADAYRDGADLAAWAILQLGPGDPGGRAAWARYWIERLDDAAFAVQGTESDSADDTRPALRAWLAMLEAYNAVASQSL